MTIATERGFVIEKRLEKKKPSREKESLKGSSKHSETKMGKKRQKRKRSELHFLMVETKGNQNSTDLVFWRENLWMKGREYQMETAREKENNKQRIELPPQRCCFHYCKFLK